MQIYSEESFGPIAAIVRVEDEAEAVSVANDTQYGLVASVFTADEARGRAIARRLETGVCHINGPTVYDDPSKPYGGVKTSGYGRFGGTTAIQEFTELRWITVQEPRSDYPFWT
jgi:benzaldehyde dehydrogenase (NAD)